MDDRRDWNYANHQERSRWWYRGTNNYVMERDLREEEYPIWCDYQKMRGNGADLSWERFLKEWTEANDMYQDIVEDEDEI
jgi:hypothetical protein